MNRPAFAFASSKIFLNLRSFGGWYSLKDKHKVVMRVLCCLQRNEKLLISYDTCQLPWPVWKNKYNGKTFIKWKVLCKIFVHISIFLYFHIQYLWYVLCYMSIWDILYSTINYISRGGVKRTSFFVISRESMKRKTWFFFFSVASSQIVPCSKLILNMAKSYQNFNFSLILEEFLENLN